MNQITSEEKAYPIMLQFLRDFGLQIALKTFADALDTLQKERGFSVAATIIIDTMRGIHNGYRKRNDGEE